MSQVLAGESVAQGQSHTQGAGAVVDMPKDEGVLRFNFQARVRGEVRGNVFDFNDGVNALTDDAWFLQRIRLGVEWQPVSWLNVTVQGQDAREFLSDRLNVPGMMGAEGDDALDLRLASVQVGDPRHLSLKVGRQVLSYGDERLVGPLEWLNFSRSFDAVKLHYEQKDWWVDAFASSVVTIERSEFNRSDWLNDESERNQLFSGIYFSTQWIPVQTTDVYVLHLHEEAQRLAGGGGIGSTDFVTFGTRFKGDSLKLRGWDYTAEFAVQTGQVAGEDLRAFATHLEFGYNWLNAEWKPRVGLEYSYGSGDGEAGDGRRGTFQNLFPTNHPYYGFMDAFSWQNMHDVVLHVSAMPMPQVKVTADVHAFWLDDTGDAWYRANGTSRVRGVSPGAGSYAGSEVDLTLSTKLTPHVDLLLGYSHFFAGDYLAATGASDDANFGYLMVTFNY